MSTSNTEKPMSTGIFYVITYNKQNITTLTLFLVLWPYVWQNTKGCSHSLHGEPWTFSSEVSFVFQTFQTSDCLPDELVDRREVYIFAFEGYFSNSAQNITLATVRRTVGFSRDGGRAAVRHFVFGNLAHAQRFLSCVMW